MLSPDLVGSLLLLELTPQPCPASNSTRTQRFTQTSLALPKILATEALDAMELKDLLGFFCTRIGAAFPVSARAGWKLLVQEADQKMKLNCTSDCPGWDPAEHLTPRHLGSPFHFGGTISPA